MPGAFVHPTALVEEGVTLGEGTKVWDNVHLRHGVKIGRSTIVGEKTYVAYDVVIGSFVKINASVYICAEVSIADFCMISAHTVFTNDRFPRAGNRELTGLETSEPTDLTLATRVQRGTTIGANATVGPGVTLGEFCMVGMGSVVTRNVSPHALVVGNPARQVGWVCACGHPLVRWSEREAADAPKAARPRLRASLRGDREGPEISCRECERAYALESSAGSPSDSAHEA